MDARSLPGHIPVWGGPIRPVEEGRRVERPVKPANDGDPVMNDYGVAMTMVHVVVRPVPEVIVIVVRAAVPMMMVAAMVLRPWLSLMQSMGHDPHVDVDDIVNI